MSLSSVRGAIIGAGIVVSSLVPTAGAEQVRARTGERVELCVPMAPEDGSGRVSISMRLERMLPDDRGCKVDIRVNNGMGAKDILSTEVPLGQYSYVNVFGPEGAKKDKTITGACTRDWLDVDTRGSGAARWACPDRPLWSRDETKILTTKK